MRYGLNRHRRLPYMVSYHCGIEGKSSGFGRSMYFFNGPPSPSDYRSIENEIAEAKGFTNVVVFSITRIV